MTISIPAAITGASQTGLTSPVYNTTVDTPPEVNQKQSVVSSLGGTQTGVTVHAISSPFILNVARPKAYKAIGPIDPVTGQIRGVPTNKFVVRTIKGVTPLAGQAIKNLIIRTEIEVPAGSDLADAPNIRAALSAHFGMCATSTFSSGLGDTLIQGTI